MSDLPSPPARPQPSFRSWSLGRTTLLAVALTLLVAPRAATSAEPPSEAERTLACQLVLKRAGERIVSTHLKSTRACLAAWDRCDTAGRDTPRCFARATRTCERALRRVTYERGRRQRTIVTACGTVANAALRENLGLGFDLLAASCRERYDIAVTDAEGIGACLTTQHTCYARAIADATRALASRASTSVERELLDAGCPTPRNAPTASIGPPLEPKCARDLTRLVTDTLLKRLRGLQGCSTRFHRCRLTSPGDSACETRTAARCAAVLARITRRSDAKQTALLARCSTDTTSASAATCNEGTGSTVGTAAACLFQRAACGASELLQFETPRGHALTTAAVEGALAQGCDLVPPTDRPPPPADPPNDFEGVGTSPTATPTPSIAPPAAPTHPTGPQILSTPTSAPTRTPTPRPTPTETLDACLGYAFAVDPTNPSTLYTSVRGRGVFKNTTAGRAPWVPLGLANVVVNAFAINPISPTTLFAATEGAGVLRSTTSGTRWETTGLFAIPNAGRVRALILEPTAPSVVYAGTQGAGIVRSTSNGASWQVTSLFSFPGGEFVRSLAFSPGATALVAGVGDGGTYRSRSRGNSWEFTSLATLPGGRAVLSLASNARTGNVVYAGAENGDVFRSVDDGNGWSATNFNAFGDGQPRALAVGPDATAIVYASRDGDVDRSVNRGGTWQTTSFAARAGNTLVCALAVARDDIQTLYAATNSGSVFSSSDRGATWRDMSAGL